MAADKLATQIRKVPARYISVMVQLALGLSILYEPALTGGVVHFVHAHFGVSDAVMGLGFIILGIMTALVIRKGMYFLVALGFLLYGIMAFIGYWQREVTLQAAIFAVGLALYTLWSFPEDANGY